MREVLVKLLAVDTSNLIINDSDAASQRLVDVSKDTIFRVENTVCDLDKGRERRAHDGLDGLGVRCSKSQAIAVAVNTRRIHGMRIDGDESFIVLEVLVSV